MRIVFFCHSLISDWNHGHAHFQRGLATELIARGHEVIAYEPEDGASRNQLIAAYGEQAVARFSRAYPELTSRGYSLATLDLDQALDGADLVVVHESSANELVARIGERRALMRNFRLLFHDTHHRAVSDPEGLARCDLRHYDGVLAFGRAIRDLYLKRGWAQRGFVFHPAADTRRFKPVLATVPEADLVFVGNFGDGERSDELGEYLIEPVKALGLRACLYGVCYPDAARQQLAAANVTYGGWLPNYDVPVVFSRFRVTVHVPRRPYVERLRGAASIRMFEALACGIPLVCSPWEDSENLFRPGHDFIVVRSGDEMKRSLRALIWDRDFAREQARSGLETILARHTCAHRAEELLKIHRDLALQRGLA